MANTKSSGNILNCRKAARRVRRTDAPNNIFKCTEKEGFYSVSEPISEQDIIVFAKQIIAAKFERGTAITSPQGSTGFLESPRRASSMGSVVTLAEIDLA